jgi:hypothetical protein
MFWFKLKKELATLDVVVVGAELGHGKRNHVLSDYTFAVRDEGSGELLPIGKAYSGLTDAEIAELTEHFKQNTLVERGRYRESNRTSSWKLPSIPFNQARATPADSPCVFPESKPFGATRRSRISILWPTRSNWRRNKIAATAHRHPERSRGIPPRKF